MESQLVVTLSERRPSGPSRTWWHVESASGVEDVAWVALDGTANARSRSYERIAQWPRPTDQRAGHPTGRARVLTSLTVSADAEAELDRWYAEEHVPLLLAVPGWLAVTRYRLVEGEAPRLLAVHELADLAPLDHPTYAEAMRTPWGGRVFAGVLARERLVLTDAAHFNASALAGEP